MKQQFDNLEYNGMIRDYRHLKVGDSVVIDKGNSILLRSLSNLLEREKSAMHNHARNIGAKLDHSKDAKGNLVITFVDLFKNGESEGGDKRDSSSKKGAELFE